MKKYVQHRYTFDTINPIIPNQLAYNTNAEVINLLEILKNKRSTFTQHRFISRYHLNDRMCIEIGHYHGDGKQPITPLTINIYTTSTSLVFYISYVLNSEKIETNEFVNEFHRLRCFYQDTSLSSDNYKAAIGATIDILKLQSIMLKSGDMSWGYWLKSMNYIYDHACDDKPQTHTGSYGYSM